MNLADQLRQLVDLWRVEAAEVALTAGHDAGRGEAFGEAAEHVEALLEQHDQLDPLTPAGVRATFGGLIEDMTGGPA